MVEPRQFRVADLGVLFDGPHATPARIAEGPYFLNIASLRSGRLDLSESDHISPEDFTTWTRRVTPRASDLLFSYETRLGEAALMPADLEACLGRRMALLRPNPAVVHPRFLLYFFLCPEFQRLIEKHTIHGATVNRIGLSTMGEWPVTLPALSSQEAIAEVLGALDDKIAANACMSDTALALADAAFALRAGTGHSDGRTFEEVADVGGGGTPSTADPTLWAGEIAWATPTDVTALHGPYLSSTSRTITDGGLAACASPLYPEGSILMTSRATIGAFAIAERSMAVNQGFIVVNARHTGSQWWLFHQMRARVSEFLSHANGATFLELSRGRFKQLPVWTAEASVIADFDALAESLHRRASAAMRESTQLACLRDTLLPELMSGRLRVRDAEQAVGELV